jgi:hypothetical protein
VERGAIPDVNRRYPKALGLRSLTVLFALSVGFLVLSASPLDAASADAPVLLVYGFQPLPGFDPLEIWQTFAETLSGSPIESAVSISIGPGHGIYRVASRDSDHLDVYISNYGNSFEPTVRDLRYYAARLQVETEWIVRSTGQPRIDLVAHSVGGLVARCYIECADLDNGTVPVGTASNLKYDGTVRTLVTLATPHLGASLVSATPWLGPLIQQLAPESELLRRLNAPTPESSTGLDPAVRYVSMAGQTCLGCGLRRDAEACRVQCIDDGLAWHGSDLVVSMESADLPGSERTACIGMDHVDMHTSRVLAEAVRLILAGEAAPNVIYGSAELAEIAEPNP